MCAAFGIALGVLAAFFMLWFLMDWIQRSDMLRCVSQSRASHQ